MQSEKKPNEPRDRWPLIGWTSLAGMVVLAAVLSFTVVSRFQQNGPLLDTWAAICRGIGLTVGGVPATYAQPPLQVPSQVAWTRETLDLIQSGDPQRGAGLAVECQSCHGVDGVSNAGLMPTLAGMNARVIYKQLDDFRNGLRPWKDMTLMASLLSPQDMSDVASYWAARPGLPQMDSASVPAAGRSLHQTDPAIRLVYAGDPERGIAACFSCHGPGLHKLGAPTLEGQRQAYIENQLVAFATGLRRNDINEQMRTVARQLTADERRQVAAFYGAEPSSPGIAGIQSPR